MIVLYDEADELANMFDTAKEFKEYIQKSLIEMEKELNADDVGLENGLLFKNKMIQEVSFQEQLNQYLDMTQETIRFK